MKESFGGLCGAMVGTMSDYGEIKKGPIEAIEGPCGDNTCTMGGGLYVCGCWSLDVAVSITSVNKPPYRSSSMGRIYWSLVFLPLIAIVSAQTPCCWYKQWEGFIAQKHGVYDRIGNYASIADIQGQIHVDYSRMMVVNELVMTNASQVYSLTTIDDYNKKIGYTVVDGQCFKSTLRAPLQDSCVPCILKVHQCNTLVLKPDHDALYKNAVLIGTHSFLGIDADIWLLPYCSKTLTMTVRVTVSRKDCVPLQEVLLTIADTSSLSFISMQNVTQGIVDPSIFNIPSICQQLTPHRSEVPKMSVIGLHSFVKQKIF
ncbi:hypothetical protein Btru_076119 [Bulinus truncatus]|nr:hypothetical protein Btru_076119 [Bulinus truncatus]